MSAACASARTAVYRRRRPERTVLYRTVQAHLATWLELSCDSRHGASGPAPIEREFRRYLECGILAHVFGFGVSNHHDLDSRQPHRGKTALRRRRSAYPGASGYALRRPATRQRNQAHASSGWPAAWDGSK